ncbi:MAG: PD-(D/E)XK nuclease family protein [Actinomyces graevenitzii]|nr:PD-(D/E)XK nuclease family protein [Actinomyces graevenitzii]
MDGHLNTSHDGAAAGTQPGGSSSAVADGAGSAGSKADGAADSGARPTGGKRNALSPSRVKDFKQCPLLFRFRCVDRLEEPGSLATHKGTVVHAVLEDLFDLPAAQRTEAAAQAMLEPHWQAHREANPAVMDLFDDPSQVEPWLEQGRALISNYFRMELPQRLEPAQRELFVQAKTDSGLLLRGFVDRLDVAPNGAMRVVDYKTGKAPAPRFMAEALFQLRFYALVLKRMRGVMPARLQLLYLKDTKTLTHDPHPSELIEVEEQLEQTWNEIFACAQRQYFPPRKSVLCGWCAHQEFCPLFGGKEPPLPAEKLSYMLTAHD